MEADLTNELLRSSIINSFLFILINFLVKGKIAAGLACGSLLDNV